MSTTSPMAGRSALAHEVLLANANTASLSAQRNSGFRSYEKARYADPSVVAYRRYKSPLHPRTDVSRPFWSKLFPGRPT